MGKSRISDLKIFIDSFKNIFKHFSKIKLSRKFAGVMLPVFLVGCTPTKVDDVAPVITSVTVEDSTIIINATDENGVKAYMVTENNTKPSAASTEWSTGKNIDVEEEGTYFAWAKDEAGNISNSKEVLVDIETIFERLAKEKQHIAWVIDPATEKTVDGVTYNLTELKQKYGILYPMVEPLSEQEIKDRWKYLVNYLVEEANNTSGQIYAGGLIVEPLDDITETKIRVLLGQYKENIYNTNDDKLIPYRSYYKYSEELNRYAIDQPKSLISRQTTSGVGIDIIEKVPIADMEWFIRNYTTTALISINTLEINNEPEENIQFWFDSQLSKSK